MSLQWRIFCMLFKKRGHLWVTKRSKSTERCKFFLLPYLLIVMSRWIYDHFKNLGRVTKMEVFTLFECELFSMRFFDLALLWRCRKTAARAAHLLLLLDRHAKSFCRCFVQFNLGQCGGLHLYPMVDNCWKINVQKSTLFAPYGIAGVVMKQLLNWIWWQLVKNQPS